MNKEKQIIEEFEERYDHLNPIYDDGKSIPTWSSGDFDDMKDFILKALKAQRKEIVEKIEKKKGRDVPMFDEKVWLELLDKKEIINLITKEDE